MWLKKEVLWKRILSCFLAMTLCISMIPGFLVSAADETVAIKDHVNNSTNAGNSGINGFYFKTDGDALDYATDWSVRYGEAVSGGITVEGAASSENEGGSDSTQDTESTNAVLPIAGTSLVENTTIVSADGSKTLTASASSEITDGVDCGDPGATKQDWIISLPKINYANYETVTMEFKGNDSWQTFGFSTSNCMADGGSAAFAGTITITNNGDGTLKGVITADSINKSIEETITDSEIVNGTSALTLYWNNGAAYRHMHIGPITGVLKEDTGDSDGSSTTTVASGSTLVGNTTIVSADGSSTLTASASSVIAEGVDCGEPGATVKEWLISLPKINYSQYETVSMEFEGNATWQSFGFSQSNRLSDGGSSPFTGTITITNNGDGTLKAVITASSHNKSVEEVITDADVINGTKAFTLSWLNGAAYRHIHIGPITGVAKEASGDTEGSTMTTVATGSALVGNTTIVSADGSSTLTASASSVIAEGVDCGDPGATVKEWLISLPKINYSQYETVSMEFEGNATWQSFGFSQSNRLSDGGSSPFKGTITITNNGDGTLKTVITASSHNKSVEEVITDADVINGTKAFTLSWLNGAAYRHMHIGPITGSLKESTGDTEGGTEGDTEEENVVITMLKVAEDTYFVDLIVAGVTPISGTKVTIEGTYTDGTDNVTFEKAIFTFDGQKWAMEGGTTEPGPGDNPGGDEDDEPVDLTNHNKVTVYITDHENNENNWGGSGKDGFYFKTNNDPLAYGTDWTVRYTKPASGGVYVSGDLKEVQLVKYGECNYYVPLAESGIEAVAGMQIVIDGAFYDTEDVVTFKKAIFTFNGTKWSVETEKEPVDLSKHKQTTVFIKDHENNLAGFGGSGENGFYFKTDNDPLDYKDDWSIRYTEPVKGGVYVNGILKQVHLIKYKADSYYVGLVDSGIKATKGMQIEINGTFYDDEDVVTFKKAIFTFDGTRWTVETEKEPVDLSKYNQVTATIKDHENNLAGFGGSGENGFYFKTDNDPLDYKDDWSARYVEPARGGVYVDGILTPVQLIKYKADSYFVGLVDSGFKATKGMQIIIDGTYCDDEDAVTFKKATFTFDGSRWTFEGEKEQVDLSRHKKVTVKVMDSDMNLGNSGTNGFYFKVEGCPLAFSSDWQTRYLVPAEGGIYLDGELKPVQLIKHREDQYFVGLVDSGLKELIKKGSKVTIDGSFYDSKYVVTFEKATFVFDGRFWMMEQEGADVEVQDMSEVTTYDLYEFTKTLSTTVCRKSSTVIGGLDSFRNTSLKMKVNVNKDAWELLLGLGKNSTNNMWLGDGYQIVIQPSNDLVLIRCDISTNVAAGYCEIPEEFVLEVGMVDVATMDGEYYGTRVFVKIDGEEVASWVDSNTARVIGRNIMYYAPDTVNATLSTARELTMLPVNYVVDGEEKDACSLVSPSQVILGEKNYYVVKKTSEQNVLVKRVSLKLNGKEAKLVAENSYSYTFLIQPKEDMDVLTIEVETAERTVDEPVSILDLYDVAVSMESNGTVVGNMVADGEALRANVAMQFVLELPDEYKESAIGIGSAVDEIFRTKGYTILFSPEGVSIRHGFAHNELSFGNTDIFKPGSRVYVECGIVKCYEDGVYKYDSVYIKAGDTLDSMEYVTWYDSTRRGGYDSGVVSNGVATLHTVKEMYTLTDTSDQSQKEKLASLDQLGEVFYQVYYPDVVISGESAKIVLYVKEGMKVSAMTIAGKRVEPVSIQDGAYVYMLEEVTADTTFTYAIKED